MTELRSANLIKEIPCSVQDNNHYKVLGLIKVYNDHIESDMRGNPSLNESISYREYAESYKELPFVTSLIVKNISCIMRRLYTIIDKNEEVKKAINYANEQVQKERQLARERLSNEIDEIYQQNLAMIGSIDAGYEKEWARVYAADPAIERNGEEVSWKLPNEPFSHTLWTSYTDTSLYISTDLPSVRAFIMTREEIGLNIETARLIQKVNKHLEGYADGTKKLEVVEIPFENILFYQEKGSLEKDQQVYSTGGEINPMGFLLGDLLFGDAGAIIGGRSRTQIKTKIIETDSRHVELKYYDSEGALATQIFPYTYRDLFNRIIPSKEYSVVQVQNAASAFNRPQSNPIDNNLTNAANLDNIPLEHILQRGILALEEQRFAVAKKELDNAIAKDPLNTQVYIFALLLENRVTDASKLPACGHRFLSSRYLKHAFSFAKEEEKAYLDSLVAEAKEHVAKEELLKQQRLEEEARRQAEEDKRRKAEEEERQRLEAEEKQRAEEERLRLEAEEKRRAEEERKRLEEEEKRRAEEEKRRAEEERMRLEEEAREKAEKIEAKHARNEAAFGIPRTIVAIIVSCVLFATIGYVIFSSMNDWTFEASNTKIWKYNSSITLYVPREWDDDGYSNYMESPEDDVWIQIDELGNCKTVESLIESIENDYGIYEYSEIEVEGCETSVIYKTYFNKDNEKIIAYGVVVNGKGYWIGIGASRSVYNKASATNLFDEIVFS